MALPLTALASQLEREALMTNITSVVEASYKKQIIDSCDMYGDYFCSYNR